MNPSAYILQLVRAHYGGDDRAFAYAANTLARHAKAPHIRRDILDIVQRGSSSRRQGHQQPSHREFQQLAPQSSSLYALPEVSFPDLLLEERLQDQLDEVVVELEYAEHLRERGLRARNRLLFHGPPGNGKTSAAAALANAMGVKAYCVSIPDVIDKYVGSTSQNLNAIFKSIREGMVVVFDEIDAVGAERGGGDGSADKEKNSVINTMLMLLDRHKSGVIVGTTNRPDILDPALRRRFDESLLFPEPTVEQMRNLAAKLCDGFRTGAVHVADCMNFDEVTKRVTQAARREVMAEILSAENEGDAQNGSTEEED